MLDALQSHRDFPNLAGVDFHLLFIEQKQARYEALDEELNRIEVSTNVHIHMVHGDFENEFRSLVDDISGRGGTLIPTFSFIDPFGYSDAPMSLTGLL